MDAERFGRALGVGVREGAKALLKAADAAAAPNPRAGQPPVTRAGTSGAGQAGRATARRVVEVRKTGQALSRGGKRFGETIWGPAARAGGVLWFEVTGVFFGLFALAAAAEVWKRRAAFAAGGDARHKVWFAIVMLVVFGWFTVQSFRKARARERRR